MLPTDRSTSPDSIEMLGVAQKLGAELVWDRYLMQLPQCGFGETGLCCRHCLQGPCRIDPFVNPFRSRRVLTQVSFSPSANWRERIPAPR